MSYKDSKLEEFLEAYDSNAAEKEQEATGGPSETSVKGGEDAD